MSNLKHEPCEAAVDKKRQDDQLSADRPGALQWQSYISINLPVTVLAGSSAVRAREQTANPIVQVQVCTQSCYFEHIVAVLSSAFSTRKHPVSLTASSGESALAGRRSAAVG